MSFNVNQPEFLFIQTLGTPHDGTIPYGLIGAINNITQTKLGIYDYQLESDLVKQAEVIAMSLHWYHSLAPVMELACYLRARTRARIITGGYTAHVFAGILRETGLFEAVLTGPAEEQLPAYCRGELPKDQQFPASLSQEIFNTTDYLSVDWFPEFFSQWNREWPVLSLTKGCCRSEGQEKNGYCCTCYARRTAYQFFFPDCPELREPQYVMSDLQRLSRHPDLHEVFAFHDPFSLPGNPYADILEHSYDLALHLYPAVLYPAAFLKQLQACFQQVHIYFYCQPPEIFTTENGRRFLAACRELRIPVICLALHPLPAELQNFLTDWGVKVRDCSRDTLPLPSPFAGDKRKLFREYYNRSVKFFLEKNLFKFAPVYMDELDSWLEGRSIKTHRLRASEPPHAAGGDDGVRLKMESGAGLSASACAVFYLVKKEYPGRIASIAPEDLVSPPLPLTKLEYHQQKPCFVVTCTVKPGCGGIKGGIISFRRDREVFRYGLYLPLASGSREPRAGQPLYLRITADMEKAVWELVPDPEQRKP